MCPISQPATSSWRTPPSSSPDHVGFYDDMGVPQQAMDDIAAQGGVTDGGVVYGQTSPALEYVTEDWFRQMNGHFYNPGAAG